MRISVQVAQDSPAANAGLVKGDVILEVNGVGGLSNYEAVAAIRSTVGEVHLTVARAYLADCAVEPLRVQSVS